MRESERVHRTTLLEGGAQTKLLDKVANVALILGVAVFLFIVIRSEFSKRRITGNSPQSLVGEHVNVPGLQFSQQHETLLLAISTSCHFCRESLPFYKDLSAQTRGKLDLIAVLSQPIAEAQAFLQQGAVSVTRVVSANLNQFGVNGTPTMLLVDTHGNVQEEWLGFQDDNARRQVLARVIQ